MTIFGTLDGDTLILGYPVDGIGTIYALGISKDSDCLFDALDLFFV